MAPLHAGSGEALGWRKLSTYSDGLLERVAAQLSLPGLSGAARTGAGRSLRAGTEWRGPAPGAEHQGLDTATLPPEPPSSELRP